MQYKTFQRWNALGYKVKKGESSHRRNESNKPLFSAEQVEKTVYHNEGESNNPVWEEMDTWLGTDHFGLF